jgi:hypothetical protein
MIAVEAGLAVLVQQRLLAAREEIRLPAQDTMPLWMRAQREIAE